MRPCLRPSAEILVALFLFLVTWACSPTPRVTRLTPTEELIEAGPFAGRTVAVAQWRTLDGRIGKRITVEWEEGIGDHHRTIRWTGDFVWGSREYMLFGHVGDCVNVIKMTEGMRVLRPCR